jgi:hypothetical protein
METEEREIWFEGRDGGSDGRKRNDRFEDDSIFSLECSSGRVGSSSKRPKLSESEWSTVGEENSFIFVAA